MIIPDKVPYQILSSIQSRRHEDHGPARAENGLSVFLFVFLGRTIGPSNNVITNQRRKSSTSEATKPPDLIGTSRAADARILCATPRCWGMLQHRILGVDSGWILGASLIFPISMIIHELRSQIMWPPTRGGNSGLFGALFRILSLLKSFQNVGVL